MVNGFQEIADREQKTASLSQIEYIVQEVDSLKEIMRALMKQVKLVREELRRLDKLRPLKNGEEEIEETQTQQ